MSSESNDAYLNKVKDEIRAQAQLLPQRPMLTRQAPPERPDVAAGAIERDRLDYSIGELTDPHYRTFVESAFRTILKRGPDETETLAQLTVLAGGGTKAEVLGNLRYSSEGRRIGARISGLLPRYALAKAGRFPIFGYLLQMGLTVAALPLLARHQRAATEVSAMLGGRIDELDKACGLLHQRIDDLHAFAHELNVARDAQSATLHEIGVMLRNRVAGLEAIANTHAGRLDELAFLRQRVYAINHWSHHLAEAFAQIEEAAAQRQSGHDALAAQVALAAAASDATRGARNAVWADLFVRHLPAQATVVALASGSDWIDLLAARGLQPTGAESVFASAAMPQLRLSNLELVAPEQFLLRSDDSSIDGISVLAFPTLARSMPVIRFLREAQRILRPGGTVLLAFAREPVTLADALLGEITPVLSMDLLQRALATTGFIDVARVDAIDSSPAVIARTGVS